MSRIPDCPRCGRGMRQIARYSDWTCECCDEGDDCPHRKGLSRWMRKLKGRRT